MLGFQSKELIVNAQLLLGDVDQYPVIDVTIDGADECVFLYPYDMNNDEHSCRVDHDLNCIKGGGGCHLREKVLAEAADTYVLPSSEDDQDPKLNYQQLRSRRGLPQELRRAWDKRESFRSPHHLALA